MGKNAEMKTFSAFLKRRNKLKKSFENGENNSFCVLYKIDKKRER